MEAWILLLAAGAVGYTFLTPLLTQIVAKVYPSATGTTATIINAVVGAAGVIIAIYFAREFFGAKVKGV